MSRKRKKNRLIITAIISLSIAGCGMTPADAPPACHAWTRSECRQAGDEINAMPDNSIIAAHDRDYIRVCAGLGEPVCQPSR